MVLLVILSCWLLDTWLVLNIHYHKITHQRSHHQCWFEKTRHLWWFPVWKKQACTMHILNPAPMTRQPCQILQPFGTDCLATYRCRVLPLTGTDEQHISIGSCQLERDDYTFGRKRHQCWVFLWSGTDDLNHISVFVRYMDLNFSYELRL